MNTKDFINKQFVETIEFLISQGLIKSRASISRDLGLSSNAISEIKGGRNNVGIDVVLKLCDLFGISVEYQLQGKGAMFLSENKSTITDPPHDNADYKETNNTVFEIDTDFVDDELEVFTNTNGNKFYLYPNGRIEIEVIKVPFPAYASYIECYEDELNIFSGFDTIRFKADHIAKGNYICFVSEGDSMWNEGGYDTPGGSEILAREIGRQFWDNLHSTKYGLIFVTKTGIMHKDIGGYNEATGMFTLLSRNPDHKPFDYPANDVYQIFNVIKRSF
ncbi:helix-turn-helix domain-containing protein [Myroides odoratus]